LRWLAILLPPRLLADTEQIYSDDDGNYLINVIKKTTSSVISGQLTITETYRKNGEFSWLFKATGDGFNTVILQAPSTQITPITTSASASPATQVGVVQTYPINRIAVGYGSFSDLKESGSVIGHQPLIGSTVGGNNVYSSRPAGNVTYFKDNLNDVRSASLDGFPVFWFGSNCAPSSVSIADGGAPECESRARVKSPIILIHGFSGEDNIVSDSIKGGGPGTWGQTAKLLTDEGYPVFEMRWLSYMPFEDAAGALGKFGKDIAKITGKKPIILAHSFGGVVSHLALQNKGREWSVNQYGAGQWTTVNTDGVFAKLITLNSPLSGINAEGGLLAAFNPNKKVYDDAGILRDVAFPRGVDTTDGLIKLCYSITCAQAGATFNNNESFKTLAINKSLIDGYTPILYLPPAKISVYDAEIIGGVARGLKEGESIVKLQTGIVKNINNASYLTVTGFRPYLQSGAFSGHIGLYSYGDGLISLMGQAAIPQDFSDQAFDGEANVAFKFKFETNAYPTVLGNSAKLTALTKGDCLKYDVSTRNYLICGYSAHTDSKIILPVFGENFEGSNKSYAVANYDGSPLMHVMPRLVLGVNYLATTPKASPFSLTTSLASAIKGRLGASAAPKQVALIGSTSTPVKFAVIWATIIEKSTGVAKHYFSGAQSDDAGQFNIDIGSVISSKFGATAALVDYSVKLKVDVAGYKSWSQDIETLDTTVDLGDIDLLPTASNVNTTGTVTAGVGITTTLTITGTTLPATAPLVITPAGAAINVSALAGSQSSAGQSINGGFSIAGSTVSLVRVHAGTTALDTWCYIDMPASTGAKSFSFQGAWTNENGKTCAGLLPAAGSSANIVFKVEARDAAGNLANTGTAPSLGINYTAVAGAAINVSAFVGSQSGAGQPINGGFSVAGSTVSLVRVHAGTTALDTWCYTDLAASTGAKSFSFQGNWINENGKTCAGLLPAAGSSANIVFKVEARDAANNLANAGTAPSLGINYTAVAGAAINVSALTGSQSSAGQPINGSFRVTDNLILAGGTVSLVRVHAGTTAADTWCYIDLVASTGAKSFSFQGNWTNENGKTCAGLLPAPGATASIVFKVEARDAAGNLANAGTAPSLGISYTAVAGAAINVSGLAGSQSSADQPINGGFSVAGSTVSLVRVHAGTTALDTWCYIDLPASTGAKSFSFQGNWTNENGKTCAGLLPASGATASIVFKVEARDAAGSLANAGTAPSLGINYTTLGAAINVSALIGSQSSAGLPINGSFSVAGSTVSLVRVHAGTTALDTWCYIDLTASTGAKSFSFQGNWINENGKTCSGILPAAGSTASIVFKVEARDAANNLANAGAAPSIGITYVSLGGLPINVSALAGSQSSAGQPINGSFSVAGSTVSMVRVHAGTTAADTWCYIDLAASTGAKSFSFQGAWTNENGKTCSGLLPAAGSTASIVFKVEARDAAGNLANAGTAPSLGINYTTLGAAISVSALAGSQSSAGQPINGSFSLAGSTVSLVRVHAGTTAADTWCYIDLVASTGAKSFSFQGNWTNQNGKTCAGLLPAAGATASIVFKVEARDAAGSLANAGTAPSLGINYTSLGAAISVSALSGSQSSAGQPINGSFSVAGSTVSLVRVHAGTTAADTWCYIDLVASTGAKSFSFQGNWTNQNGKTCAGLLPAPGATASIVFKVEARDAAGNLANAGTAPELAITYSSLNNVISISNVSPVSGRAGTAVTVTVSGANLPTTLAININGQSTGCSAITRNTTQASFNCPLDVAGIRLMEIKTNTAANGGVVIASSFNTFTVDPALPNVTGITPVTGSRTVPTTFTISGTNLPSTLALDVAGLACDNVNKPAFNQITCQASATAGARTATVKSAPGGTVLYTGSVSY
jgi:hypothetical protein